MNLKGERWLSNAPAKLTLFSTLRIRLAVGGRVLRTASKQLERRWCCEVL